MAKHSLTPQRSESNTPTQDHSYRANYYDNKSTRSTFRKSPHSGTNISFGEEEDYQTRTPISPPISFHNMRSQSFSSAKIKVRPLLKKKSSDTPAIDLSKSMAENEEGLGIFTQPPRAAHTRSSSGVSAVTIGSINLRNGSQYRHGQPYTPPFNMSRSRAQSSDDLPSTSYAPIPKTTRTPPPLHIRTHSTSSNPRIRSSSQLHLDHPQSASSVYREPFSPESMGKSGRSSMESAFRRRKTNDTDVVAAAAEARREFAARQEAKRLKYERQEARLREKKEHLQEKRSRAGTLASEKDSTISSIKYNETRPGIAVDKELQYIRAGVRPPRERGNTASTIKKKARGTMNSFEKFFYDLHTAWLKFLVAIGLKKRS